MTNHLESLAELLEYPDETWSGRIVRCRHTLAGASGSSLAELERFCSALAGLSLDELQERYTQTFDLNPICTLEVGFHLFGENYKRGIFLAQLRQTESPFALGQARQLPDYLPVMLRLLQRLDDRELREDLVSECMLPALAKMIEAACKADSPYVSLLRLVSEGLAMEGSDRGGISAQRLSPSPERVGATGSQATFMA